MENKCYTFSCVVSGDICQQFTKEMFDMYQGFAFYKNWDFEVLNYTPAEYGKAIFVSPPSVFVISSNSLVMGLNDYL